MTLPQAKVEPWYAAGLRFKCTGCGGCCTGAPGHVWVTHEEIENMAQQLRLSVPDFTRLYLRKVGNRISLKEKHPSFDCVFLEGGKKCSIYNARPAQCQTFPWWPSQIKNRETWEEASLYCEGINHPEAPLVPAEEIQAICKWEQSLENDRRGFR